jgi:hypothetical protein
MARAPLTTLERILVGLELAIGTLAFAGGALLMADPSGRTVGFRPDTLAGTPFPDFFVPGLVLAVAVGAFAFAVASAAILGRPWAKLGHLAYGAVLFGWIVVQVLLIGWGNYLQPTVLMLGVLIAVLASAQLRGGLDLG